MANGRPWHVSVVGWLAVLWTGLAAADYLLTRFEVPAYLALFTETQAAFVAELPLWIDVLWPVAVWAGLAGALCLVGGVRRAAFLLGLAAVATVLATLGLVFIAEPPMQVALGPIAVWVMIGSSVAYLVLWLYARQMHAYGRVP